MTTIESRISPHYQTLHQARLVNSANVRVSFNLRYTYNTYAELFAFVTQLRQLRQLAPSLEL